MQDHAGEYHIDAILVPISERRERAEALGRAREGALPPRSGKPPDAAGPRFLEGLETHEGQPLEQFRALANEPRAGPAPATRTRCRVSSVSGDPCPEAGMSSFSSPVPVPSPPGAGAPGPGADSIRPSAARPHPGSPRPGTGGGEAPAPRVPDAAVSEKPVRGLAVLPVLRTVRPPARFPVGCPMRSTCSSPAALPPPSPYEGGGL